MSSIQTLLDRLRAQVVVPLDTLKVSGPSSFARRTQQVGSLRTRKGRQMLWRSALPLLAYAVAFVIAQYAGAALAFAVSPKLEGATPLYLQGAVTVSALLLTPPRRWWLYLLLTLPLIFIDAWLLSLAPSAALMRVLLFVYIILVCIAVLTVSLLRRFVTVPLRFASVGEISRFVACVAVGAVPAAFIATVLRSVILSWDFWLSWQSGFFGYVLGIVIFTPAIVLWLTDGPGGLGLTSRGRRVEIALLSLTTVAVSVFVFATQLPDDTVASALSYLLVPVLLWAAVRFSPLVVGSTLAIATIIAIIGAVNHGGPFVFSSTTANVLALQLYLVFIGVPFYVLAALVQERKQADGALRASEARYRGVVESQTELISRSLPDTTLTFVNEAHTRHLGKSPEELLGQRWIELVPDAERERVQRIIDALLEQPGVATIEHAVTLPDGSLGWQQWVNRSLGDAQGRVIELQSVGRDVTERKRLEQEREEARAQAERQAEELARVFETVTDGVAVYDQQGQEVRTNAALHRLLGLDMAPPEYAHMALHERMALFAARDEQGRPLAPNEGPLPRALAGVAGAEAMDLRSRTLDGREIELNISAAPLRSRTGQLEGVVCVFRDQTERNQLARERAAQAEQLDRVFEQVTDGVVIYDTEGQVLRRNAAAHRLLGLDAAPAGYDQLSPDARMALFALRDEQGRALAPEETPLLRIVRGEAVSGPMDQEVWARTLDGREVQLSTSTAPLRDGEGHLVGAVYLVRDVTERRRLAREHAAQAAQLDRIFEGITDGLVAYDAQGLVVRTNAAARHILGLDAAPPDYARLPAGERAALFVAHDEQGRPLANEAWPLIQVLSGQVATGAVSRDVWLRMLDGRELEVYTSAAPLRDQEGRLVGAVTILRDETERKRLERERAAQAEQLDRVFEGMGDGVFVYDAQGQVVRTNRAARHILGLDAAPPDIYHLPVAERLALYAPREAQDGHLLTPEEWLGTRALRGDVLGVVETQDLRMRSLDGRELEVSASVAPLRDHEGQLVGAVLLLGDRTEQRRLERERTAAQLGEQEAQLREEAALEANRRMEQFLATASHDLRTPVTVALGQVQLAQRRFSQLAPAATGSPAAAVGESLTKADQALHRLKQQVARLFDLAQLQAGQLELVSKPLDLVALVQDTVAAQRVASPGRSIRLRLPKNPSAWVRGDADRLDQVLSNYLSNAVKYSPPDRPITVQLQVERGGWARVTVQDRGPGIPPEQQAHVWELFHRMPGSAEQRGSLGLGLYLCKTLVERHRGEVGLKSEMGQGTTFYFRLPLTSSTDVPTP